MITASELQERLESLKACISKRIEILDVRVGGPHFRAESMEGVLSVRLRRANASVVMIPKPEGSLTIEIWPESFRRDRNKGCEADLLEVFTHLEAVSACWKARFLGTAERVYHVPKPVIAELWTVPRNQLDFVISKYEQSSAIRAVTRTDIHVVMVCSGTKWWFSRPDTAAGIGAGYAARPKGSRLGALRSRSCSQEIRGCLGGLGAARIR